MSGFTPPDLDHRRLARLSLKKNIVVEAGAGTGKTTLLADRILFTLLAGGPKGTGSDVTRVAALTFTEKAAGEIKERLHQRLLDLLARMAGRDLPGARAAVADAWLAEARADFKAGPEEVTKMAHQALSRLDRAAIGTIHSFAAGLLRLHPLEAGVDPGFVVDEGPGFEESFAAEWARHLDAELGQAAPNKAAWVLALRRMDLSELEALARDLASEAARLGDIGTTPAAAKRVAELAKAVREIPKGKPKPHAASKILERLDELTDRLDALAAAVKVHPKLEPEPRHDPLKTSSWPKAWAEEPGEEQYIQACALAEACSPQAEAAVARARELVAAAAEQAREELNRRGRLGFDGLLARARDLVKDDLASREALKARFDAFLVDEFQDTDPLQGELLLFLAEKKDGKASRWQDVVPAPGRLFVVGDPKQSIYRFRGADIRAYESFAKHLTLHGALSCDLTTNFRSHEGLVAPVNAVFSKLLTYEQYLQPGYKPLSSDPGKKRPEGNPIDLVLVTGAESEDDIVPNDLSAAVQARWAATWLKENCGSKKRPYRDAAFLFRTAARMRPFVAALKENAIPYAVEAEGAYFGTPEVQDFLCVLRVLADPRDKVSLAALLRSPLAALEDRELLSMAEAKALDYEKDPPRKTLSDGPLKRVDALFAQLRELRQAAGREPLGAFVARVLDATFLVESSAAAYHGEQAPANLLKLSRLAAEAGEADGLTLREFAARAAELASEDKEGESPLADEGVDAVRLLTMHKAKGLEFPVVFLPELARATSKAKPAGALYDWGEGALGLRVGAYKDAAWHFNDAARSAREERERSRLLYVAMTRPREKLILMGNAAPFRSDKASLASLLAKAGAWPPAGEHPEEATFPITWLPALEPTPLRPAPDASSAPVDAGALGTLWQARFAERDSLNKGVFAAPSSHEEWDGALEESDASPRATAILLGTLCHRVLEKWSFKDGGDLQALIAAACSGLKGCAPEMDWAALSSSASALLTSFVKSPAASMLASAEILGREVPYLRRLADGTVERGAMDVLYRKGGRLFVGDYKTGGIEDAGKKWGAQGKAYTAAVKEALGEEAGFVVVGVREGKVVEV